MTKAPTKGTGAVPLLAQRTGWVHMQPHGPHRPQVVREALTKDYAAMAYDQPYQRALYSGGQLQEARKWHVDEYAAVIGGLSAADLQVCCCSTYVCHSTQNRTYPGVSLHYTQYISDHSINAHRSGCVSTHASGTTAYQAESGALDACLLLLTDVCMLHFIQLPACTN